MIAENVPELNKNPAEKNFGAFNEIFGIDVNGVKCFKS